MPEKEPPPFTVGKHYDNRIFIKIIFSGMYIVGAPFAAFGLLVLMIAILAFVACIMVVVMIMVPFLMPYVVYMEVWAPPGTEPRLLKDLFTKGVES